MNLQQLKNEAYKLSVSDRLTLIESISRTLSSELRAPKQLPEGVLEKLKGCLKTDAPPPTDEEVEAMLQQRREEKYL
ncbi:MAG TPA: hypothetical protein V6D28_07875 [Leptolyngbyaceae cyanobacterium]